MYEVLLRYIPREGLILDAGCGFFKYSNNLKKYGKRVTTIDIFIPDIAEAKRNSFLLASIENLPFKDNSFDFVYCLSVLEFVKDDVRAINEFRRILKPGGNLLFSAGTSRSVFRLLRDLEIAFGVYKWAQFNVKHCRYYTRGDIRKLVDKKFVQIDIRGYRYNFIPRLCGFLILVSRFKSILKLLRLYKLLKRIRRRIGKKGANNKTANNNLNEETVINIQRNGTLNSFWDKFEFLSDLSYHYMVNLKK